MAEFGWLNWVSRRGAKLGHAGSMCMLGALVERTGGPLRNANRYYRIAADHGSRDAMWNLGVNYLGSKGGERQEALALFWIAAAAEKGQPLASWALGRMHLAGSLVPKDQSRAIDLLKRSAAGGCRDAALMLVGAYRDGRYGVDADMQEARIWARCSRPGVDGMIQRWRKRKKQ
ncbi:MAG: hypothetical protein DHS20C11_18570 [Lysobacteraceae bacterium]|nr:MAG: hypothetical protein DHS20C11_18570 [Xanthomonadaceae bacterium]